MNKEISNKNISIWWSSPSDYACRNNDAMSLSILYIFL